jgi:hypothetical protein
MHLCTQDQVVFSTAILGAVAHGLYALSLLPQGEETRSQYQASGCGVALSQHVRLLLQGTRGYESPRSTSAGLRIQSLKWMNLKFTRL